MPRRFVFTLSRHVLVCRSLREAEGTGGSLSWRARHCQIASVVFDQTLDVREAQAGSIFLCREEGFEDP